MDKRFYSKRFLMGLAIGVLGVIVGAFLTFGVVLGFIFNGPAIASDITAFNFDRRAEKLFEDMEKEMNSMTGMPAFSSLHMKNSSSFGVTPAVQTEATGKEYKIKVNLKAFGNNEENVKVKKEGNHLIVSAQYEQKGKDSFNSSNFYNSFTVDEKTDISKLKKEKKGNTLLIIIPKAE